MTNGSNDTPALDTRYEFLPSVREGYRPTRSFADRPHTGRTSMGVSLDVQGVPADGGDWESASDQPSVDLRMYGPGDVTGINEGQVVRVEPEPNSSSFAPNYFPLVEFDRADLPWLFSPERADESEGGKLRPWMALVVVDRSNDDVSVEADGTKPLSALTTPRSELPPIEEVWAWAHVQVVGQLSDSELGRAMTEPNDQVVSRLLCPRNLDANTRYVAAVVPTFEAGRRAGLGQDPFGDTSGDSDPPIDAAWDHTADGTVTLPIYHQWSFTTGAEGDFESLARKLEPTRLDRHEVGVREIDVSDPGRPALKDPGGMTRRVGGALQSPGLDTADYPGRAPDGTDTAKREELRKLLNDPRSAAGMGDSDGEGGNGGPDEVVGPPIYGQWYLPEDANWDLDTTGVPEPPGLPETDGTTGLAKYYGSWIHDLNCDPQYRLPASYGTEVIQENQERLMEAAWKMFGDLERANEQVGSSQAGDVVGAQLRERMEGVDTARFSQRIVDPARLDRAVQQLEDLHRAGALTGEHVVENVMTGATLPSAGPAVGEMSRRGIATGDLTPGGETTTPGQAEARLDVEARAPAAGAQPGGSVDDGLGGGFGTDTGPGGDVGTGAGFGQGSGVDVGTAVGGGDTAGGDGVTTMPGGDVTTVGTDSGGRLEGGNLVSGNVGRTGIATDPRLTSNLGGAAGAQQETLAKGDGKTESGEDGLLSDGAGPLAMAETATQIARMSEVNSSSFRTLTRQGGKLAKGVEMGSEAASAGADIARERRTQQHGFGSEQALGSRFAGVSERTADVAEAEPPPEEDETGIVPPAGDPPGTDWRVDDAGTVLSLEEAASRLDGALQTVPRALLAVESVRDHCDAARGRLDELQDHLDAVDRGERGAAGEVVASLTDRPTAGDRCRAIGRNTYDALARQLGKLVATDPEPLAPDFGNAHREAVLERFRTEQDALVEAVEEARAEVEGESFDPAVLRDRLAAAREALTGIEKSVDAVERSVDSGIPPGARPGGESSEMASMRTMSMETDRTMMGPGAIDSAMMGPGATDAAATVDASRELEVANAELDVVLTEGPETTVPGVLDASGWTKQAAAWRLSPELLERDVELAPILAAPEFEQPMYRWLKRVDQTYLLPGADGVPKNSVGAVETNSEFIESFLCGCNHEMGRELLWRKYPTDRRATYFRQFWEYIDQPDRTDIRKLHRWRTNDLGGNRGPEVSDDRVVLLVRGELLEAYPNTRIYAVKAVREDRTDSNDDRDWDRMPLLERKRQQAIEERKNGERDTLPDYDQGQLEQWKPKRPIFRGKLDPGITFLGFELTTEAAEGDTLEETEDLSDEAGEADAEEEYGWFFVLEEPVGETRFGLDVASDGDYGDVPYGITHGPGGNRTTGTTTDDAEHGWQGLSWGHLVDDEGSLDAKTHVHVGQDNPGGGSDPAWAVEAGERWNPDAEAFEADQAATWGLNSAHMASITWQLPVRICIHADDMLPDVSDDDGGGDGGVTVTGELAADTRSDLVITGGED